MICFGLGPSKNIFNKILMLTILREIYNKPIIYITTENTTHTKHE